MYELRIERLFSKAWVELFVKVIWALKYEIDFIACLPQSICYDFEEEKRKEF